MNERDQVGRTPLHYVAVDLPAERHADETRRLIELGHDPNAQDAQGWAPLHFAAQEWSEAAARVLIENGADVELQDAYGNTPLGRAVFASEGRGELIRLLLAAGADPDRQNHHEVSPRSLAETIGNYDVAQYFDPSGSP